VKRGAAGADPSNNVQSIYELWKYMCSNDNADVCIAMRLMRNGADNVSTTHELIYEYTIPWSEYSTLVSTLNLPFGHAAL
jgi:hypothetical protein